MSIVGLHTRLCCHSTQACGVLPSFDGASAAGGRCNQQDASCRAIVAVAVQVKLARAFAPCAMAWGACVGGDLGELDPKAKLATAMS